MDSAAGTPAEDAGGDAADKWAQSEKLSQAVGPSTTIQMMRSPDELNAVATLFQQIWGSTSPVVSIELLRAITYAGGYVSGAWETNNQHQRLVGASVGFLGRHDGQISLHSHITGVLAGVRSSGLGRAMKYHQREWCAEHDIGWITWTFDPLVQRNAWFNIEVLGAEIADYLINFYGTMDDAINAGDESDRLVAAWRVDGSQPKVEIPDDWDTVLVDVPESIVALRRTDPATAERWRLNVRRELGEPILAGAKVTGFNRDGQYVVRVPPTSAA